MRSKLPSAEEARLMFKFVVEEESWLLLQIEPELRWVPK